MKKMIALLLASVLTVVTMASCTVSIKKNSDNASSQPAESSEEVSSEETGAKADALFTYQITIDDVTSTHCLAAMRSFTKTAGKWKEQTRMSPAEPRCLAFI